MDAKQPPKKPPVLIEVVNVSKQFKVGGKQTTIIKHADFTIYDGSFTIIYGPSGSGKSTLLNMLMGIEAPTTGSVSYNAANLYAMPINERAFFRAHTMGVIQQTDHWVKSLTVLDNVALPLEFLGVKRQAAVEGALTALRRVGLEHYAAKYPMVLSGGEQQRVAMARALVNNPSYIVADEPTGNLDSANGDALIRVLRDMNKNFGRTVVLVTHNLEYLSLADQILVVEDGVVTEKKDEAAASIAAHLLEETKKRIAAWSVL